MYTVQPLALIARLRIYPVLYPTPNWNCARTQNIDIARFLPLVRLILMTRVYS